MPIILQAYDDKEFKVDKQTAERSLVLKSMIERAGDSIAPIPLPKLSSLVLEKVIMFCKHHKADQVDKSKDYEDILGPRKMRNGLIRDMDEWDKEFIKVDKDLLMDIVMAANFLDIKNLLDIGCLAIAYMLTGKTPEEIRATFGIPKDFAPGEEERIEQEHAWALRP
ncbi:hypothetical protein BG011_001653 [Mortierella polycephala]|uniref:E3 ubiquitin ligase complex SCF subunit n=1 Tax=Mortierella polycephala TaxID=41804 RepID=A0A9P6Q519_9FUNG|nr:hypothetical protein BG011_001653 [Mortierella polycephala]